MKVGLVITPLNNFKGFTETVWSAKSVHDLETIVEPQFYWQKPLAQAWNDGAKRAFERGCEYAVVCNDDILFSPDTIDAMIEQYELLHESDKVVMVTPNNIRLQLADPYDILKYVRPADPFTYSEHPNFSCFLIHKDFFDLCGTFDENFVPAWYEDNDMHRRITLLGYKAIMTTAAPQIHFGGISTGMIENNPGSGQSQAYYIKKWGGIPVTHPEGGVKEHFATPYNDPALTPKDWVRQ